MRLTRNIHYYFHGIYINRVINDTGINYTFYLLLYYSVNDRYNVIVITMIFTDPANQSRYLLFRTVANIQPTPDKSLQVMDIISIMNRTTLSEHYKILSKTLRYLGDKEPSTKWVLTKLGKELNKLSKIAEHQLKEYNTQKAYGIGIIADGFWSCLTCSIACNLVAVSGLAAACTFAPELCAELVYWYSVIGRLGCVYFCYNIVHWCP